MFKNALLYRIVSADLSAALANLADAMDAQTFTPCGATQEKSIGWVSPRGDPHGALVEVVAGQWLVTLQTEVKRVPQSALQERVDAACAAIEAQTGRKPGKKERRDLTDDARLALLPHAFSAKHRTTLWIDPATGLLLVAAASQSKADDAVTALVKALEGVMLQRINTNTAPATAMAHWLREREAPAGFSIDRECELKAADESKAVVKYGRHPLDIDEVAQHVAQGKLPTKLALTWADRVSFVLTEGLQLKKITLLDVAFADSASAGDSATDHFDADAAIATGELSRLVPDLLQALGGETAAAQTKSVLE